MFKDFRSKSLSVPRTTVPEDHPLDQIERSNPSNACLSAFNRVKSLKSINLKLSRNKLQIQNDFKAVQNLKNLITHQKNYLHKLAKLIAKHKALIQQEVLQLALLQSKKNQLHTVLLEHSSDVKKLREKIDILVQLQLNCQSKQQTQKQIIDQLKEQNSEVRQQSMQVMKERRILKNKVKKSKNQLLCELQTFQNIRKQAVYKLSILQNQ